MKVMKYLHANTQLLVGKLQPVRELQAVDVSCSNQWGRYNGYV